MLHLVNVSCWIAVRSMLYQIFWFLFLQTLDYFRPQWIDSHCVSPLRKAIFLVRVAYTSFSILYLLGFTRTTTVNYEDSLACPVCWQRSNNTGTRNISGNRKWESELGMGVYELIIYYSMQIHSLNTMFWVDTYCTSCNTWFGLNFCHLHRSPISKHGVIYRLCKE